MDAKIIEYTNELFKWVVFTLIPVLNVKTISISIIVILVSFIFTVFFALWLIKKLWRYQARIQAEEIIDVLLKANINMTIQLLSNK